MPSSPKEFQPILKGSYPFSIFMYFCLSFFNQLQFASFSPILENTLLFGLYPHYGLNRFWTCVRVVVRIEEKHCIEIVVRFRSRFLCIPNTIPSICNRERTDYRLDVRFLRVFDAEKRHKCISVFKIFFLQWFLTIIAIMIMIDCFQNPFFYFVFFFSWYSLLFMMYCFFLFCFPNK